MATYYYAIEGHGLCNREDTLYKTFERACQAMEVMLTLMLHDLDDAIEFTPPKWEERANARTPYVFSFRADDGNMYRIKKMVVE